MTPHGGGSEDARARGGEGLHDEREHLRGAAGYRAVLEWPRSERTWFLGISADGFTWMRGEDLLVRFDLEGRPRRVHERGMEYLRGFDGRLLRRAVRRRGRAPAVPGALDSAGVLGLFELVHEALLEALLALEREAGGSSNGPDPGEGLELLRRAAGWTPERLVLEGRRFLEVHSPLGILPPDRYRNLILQATCGCAWNRCGFCSLYRGVPYRVRSLEEFRAHARGVKAFFGRAMVGRRGVFLGEANALDLPPAELRPVLEVVREEFPDLLEDPTPPAGGVALFSDVFGGPPPRIDALESFRERGLARVYLGVESGSEDVLRALGKPSGSAVSIERVGLFRSAGISSGVILLAGLGGEARAPGHVRDSLDLLARLELPAGERVYLSPLVIHRARDRGVPSGPEDGSDAGDAEYADLAAGIRALGLRVGRYDVGSFVYA